MPRRPADEPERTARRFYDGFMQRRLALADAVGGLAGPSDRLWYAAAMLNRLMFLYFMQRRGFLDGDPDYLRSRLRPGFHRSFLLPLFHDGHLDAGIFAPHALELAHPDIVIADAAFAPLFDFFDGYGWRLDDGEARAGEITPDLLGDIFERYVNQKQMGAYYTKPDVTLYIAANTIVPWLFNQAAARRPEAFLASGPVWRLLAAEPDRYIHPAVQAGARVLPSETPAETAARRQRHADLRVAAGSCTRIDDLVTANFDLRRFGADVIRHIDDPDLLLAFWSGLTTVRVLDPACGSGAFLLAALAVLQDLYAACLDRMEALGAPAFRRVLAPAGAAADRTAFICRTIIAANLEGVDIMEEAVEICRLRLVLKLAAQQSGRPALAGLGGGIRTGDSLASTTGRYDVVIGNPPYIAMPPPPAGPVLEGFATVGCPDLYAPFMERAATLCTPGGYCGMIVPLSLTFSGAFRPLRALLQREYAANWYASFARIPAALFSVEVRVRNTIHIGRKGGRRESYTTRTHRWFEAARPHLLQQVEYAAFDAASWGGLVPKLGSQRLLSRIEEAVRGLPPMAQALSRRPTDHRLHFRRTAYNWVSFAAAPAPAYDARGQAIASPEYGQVSFSSRQDRDLAFSLLNGKLALLWWMIVGDDFHATRGNFASMPFPVGRLDQAAVAALTGLVPPLTEAMCRHTVFKLNAGKRIGNYNLARCRAVTDIADRIWADALGLTDCWPEIELAYARIVKTGFGPDDSAGLQPPAAARKLRRSARRAPQANV